VTGRDAAPTEAAAGLARLLDDPSLRAKSLISTLFGDSLLPMGGGVWLSDLIALAAPLRISERMTRTAVFRLRRDGLLQATRRGRRSHYSLTDEGRRQFRNAEHRIYGAPRESWDGVWTLALLTGSPPEAPRRLLVRDLRWAGFAALAPGLYARPGAELRLLEETVTGLGLGRDVLTLRAETLPGHPLTPTRRIVEAAWPLDDIAAGYRALVRDVAPLAEGLDSLGDEQAFILRTLLIDRYRRILLRDPDLPLDLLPRGWPGRDAAALAARIYRRVALPAQNHVAAMLQSGHTAAPQPPDRAFHERFGGI